MPDWLQATPEMAIEYARWFVNRRAYTLQSDTPHPASGRHYYYRPRKRGNSIALEAANPTYETRIFGPDQVKVQGRLVGLLRKY